jgi:hypothetical protein
MIDRQRRQTAAPAPHPLGGQHRQGHAVTAARNCNRDLRARFKRAQRTHQVIE